MDTTKIYYLALEDKIPFYVGKTHDLSERLREHRRLRKNQNINIHLLDEVDDWKFWEGFWIAQFRGWGFILENKNNGGGGVTTHSLKTKNSISNTLKGREFSHITKNKMCMAKKGSKDTAETKAKKSKAALGKVKTQSHRLNLSKSATKSFGKKIIQYDLGGNFIREWDTAKQASKELGLGYTAINHCCRKNFSISSRQRDKNKFGKFTSHSYIWEYKLN